MQADTGSEERGPDTLALEVCSRNVFVHLRSAPCVTTANTVTVFRLHVCSGYQPTLVSTYPALWNINPPLYQHLQPLGICTRPRINLSSLFEY